MNTKALFLTLFSFACLFTAAMSAIEAGQSVYVVILGVPAEEKAKIDAVYPISEEGMINLPFIGKLQAAGIETKELAEKIQKGYHDAEIYKGAIIQVIGYFPFGPNEKFVHLGGQISIPGPQKFTEGMTIYQAVQLAGGVTDFGDLEQVVLWRSGTEQILDFTKAQGKAVILKPNDTIEVVKITALEE